jgi:hypothetical protein
MTVTAYRLDLPDSWIRCDRCSKRKLLLVGGVQDRPADIHWCPACDPAPEAVWHVNPPSIVEAK